MVAVLFRWESKHSDTQAPNQIHTNYPDRDAGSMDWARLSNTCSSGIRVLEDMEASEVLADMGSKVGLSSEVGWYKVLLPTLQHKREQRCKGVDKHLRKLHILANNISHHRGSLNLHKDVLSSGVGKDCGLWWLWLVVVVVVLLLCSIRNL